MLSKSWFRNNIIFGILAFLVAANIGCSGSVFENLLGSPQIVSISLTPAERTVPSGVPVEYTVVASLSDNTTRALKPSEMSQVSWSNDNPAGISAVDVALSSGGTSFIITGIKTIYNDGIDVTVTLTAVYRNLTATATLTLNDASLTEINITPGLATMKRQTTQQFTAKGTYSDGSVHEITSVASWSTDDANVASISSGGIVFAQNAGSTNIHASYEGINENAPAQVTVETPVLQRVVVSPSNKKLPNGMSQQYSATAVYNDDTSQDVTNDASWVSSDTGVADMSAVTKGLVETKDTGTTTIKATFDGQEGSAALEVTNATLQYVVISADSSSIAKGTKLQFTAKGVFSDNSSLDVTSVATWSSTDTNVAQFEFDASDPKGVITAIDKGSTTVKASYGGKDSQNYDLTVSDATLDSIIITPSDPVAYVIAYGTKQQFTATGVFSDSTTQDITLLVDWASSDTTVANIDTSGLATTANEGTTQISAKYPKSGPYTLSESTNMSVVFLALESIEVTPTTKDTYVGQEVQYYATGRYQGGYQQDLTTQVLWQSSNDSIATVSNASDTAGLATAIAAGTATITAKRAGVTSNSATLNVAAGDTDSPTIVSAQLLSGNRVKVTFSEAMDYAQATNAGNYKIITSASLTGQCSDNTNFTGTPAGLTISSVDFYTQSVYILNLGEGTNNTEYTLIGDKDALADIASNTLDCPNTATFRGVDTVPPYLVSVVNSEPTKLIVKYSEPMTTGGGTSAADNLTNYTLEENPSDGNDGNNVSITSISKIDDSTFILNLDKTTQSINYKITVNAQVTDQAVVPNTMGSPRMLTFDGNEQLKVVSAEAVDLTHVKVTFSKPVSTTTAECSGASDCHTKYKLFPRDGGGNALLGDITSAVRGTGNETNTVVITHSIAQEGISYTIVVANAKDGDGFDNGSTRIESAASSTDYVQASPKDRATFMGLGMVIENFDDGEYFEDPFADGSSFSWSFVYAGRVYLGTNDLNNGAFRFDPDGRNSVLVSFDFVDGIITPACSGAVGFGYGSSPNCSSGSMGYNGERGVVGFNSATVTISSTDYEILLVGPIKDGVTNGYFTQDTDTVLDWKPFGFTVTGGNNTKSIQTLYACDNHLYLGFSSDHNQQAPIVSHHTVTESGGVLQVASGTDMSIRTVSGLGKQGGNSATIVGIDSMIKYKGYLYMANNGDIRYSSDFTGFTGSTSSKPATQSNITLWLNSLEKVSPGYRGVPKLLEYNGKLYMARNVTDGTPDNYHRVRGELWKCDPGGNNVCEPAEWTRIITGTETDLAATGAVAISMLQNNGDGVLYVGFDSDSGISVWRIASTDPPATSGTMSGAGWTQQGGSGLGNGHKVIYSATSIYDGTSNYIYLTAGGDSKPIKVYRQKD